MVQYINRPQLLLPVVPVPKKRKKPRLNSLGSESNKGEIKKPNTGSRTKPIAIAKQSSSSSTAAFLPSNPDVMHKEVRLSHDPSNPKEAEIYKHKPQGEALPDKDSSKERSNGKDIVSSMRDRSMAGDMCEVNTSKHDDEC